MPSKKSENFRKIMDSLEDDDAIKYIRQDKKIRKDYIKTFKLIDNSVISIHQDKITSTITVKGIEFDTIEGLDNTIEKYYMTRLIKHYIKYDNWEFDYKFQNGEHFEPIMFRTTDVSHYDINSLLVEQHKIINPLYIFGRTCTYPLIGQPTKGKYQFDVVNAIYYNDFKHLLKEDDNGSHYTISIKDVMRFE